MRRRLGFDGGLTPFVAAAVEGASVGATLRRWNPPRSPIRAVIEELLQAIDERDDWLSLHRWLAGLAVCGCAPRPEGRVGRYSRPMGCALDRADRDFPPPLSAMTSEQAAQLIDNTLDLVHHRLQHLQDRDLSSEHRALAAEFREWRQPPGGHIDLMVFPGLTSS